jgi:hypothetical protein
MDWITNWLYNLCHSSDAIVLFMVVVQFLFGCVFGLLVSSISYGKLMMFKQESAKFKRMIDPYERAWFLIQHNSPSDARKILIDLGSEALAESADWYLTVGERELTLPR